MARKLGKQGEHNEHEQCSVHRSNFSSGRIHFNGNFYYFLSIEVNC